MIVFVPIEQRCRAIDAPTLALESRRAWGEA